MYGIGKEIALPKECLQVQGKRKTKTTLSVAPPRRRASLFPNLHVLEACSMLSRVPSLTSRTSYLSGRRIDTHFLDLSSTSCWRFFVFKLHHGPSNDSVA